MLPKTKQPSIKKEILTHARIAVRNRRLKWADIVEWAFGEIWPQADEVVVPLLGLGCNICLRRESDRRITAQSKFTMLPARATTSRRVTMVH